MKKILLLFLTAVLGFGSLRVSAQETLTVADGTQSNYYVPIYGLYMDYYLRTQIIYPESMLTNMVGGTITELSFYFETQPADPSEWTSTMSVGMAIVNQSTFNYDFLNTPTDIVYTGTLNASSSVMTITLTTPYVYTGGNLFLEFTTASTPGGYSSGYFYGVEAIGASVTGSNSSSLSGIATANSRDFIPKTTFTYSSGSVSCPPVGSLSVSGVTSNDATITWPSSVGGNSHLVQYKPSSVQSWNSSSVVSDVAYDTTYSFSGQLNPTTTYNVRVACLCDDGDTSIFRSTTFTTACGPTSALPLTENFDGFSHTSNDNNVLPNCWDYLNTGSSSSNHPTVYYSSSNAYSGNYSLRFYTGSGSGYTDQYVFLPALDLNSVSLSNLSLGLYMRRQGNSGTFRLVVGVTEGTDTTTFVAVDTLVANSGTYAYRETSFSSYSGNGDRVCLKAFKPTSSNNRGYVDDLILGDNLCAKPSSFAVTDVDEYSVTLQWTEVGTASVWEIEYGPVGFTTGSGTTVTASTNPFTIGGLTPATTYEFQVRADCGGATSDWTSRITASTNCLPLTSIPFSEDFSGYTHTNNPNNGTGTTNVPLCWDTYNSGSSYPAYPYVYYSTSSSYSGNYSLRFYASSGSNYADQYAILPALDASIPLNTLQVSMMARSNSATTPFILVVGEMSGGPSTFEAIDTLTITGTAYNAYIAYLDGYAGSGNRIALKAPKLSSNNRGYVDDIVVELLSNCRMASDVHVSDVTTNSADVSWTSHGDETSWIVEYRATGDTVWQTLTATTNPFVLTGLNNATTYQVHVMANCVTEVSNATANVNFTTLTCDTADQCLYTFALTDDFGDGWNGASITVRQNGITVGNVTLSDDYSATVQMALCDGLTTTISWSTGSYDSECSFTITDPFGDTFYSISSPSSGTLTSFTPSCVQSSCAKPTSVAVTNVGASTVTVNWVSAGNETAWNVEYKPSNSSTWTVEPTTTNPHVLYGLTASTNYDLRVQADCGDELSAYRDGSFVTAGCEISDQCPYEFVLTDSYGDGWNDAALNVQQNGVTIATMTIPSGQSTATYQVALCDSSNVTLTWTSGNYDTECSFVVYNANSDVVYTSGNLNSGTITTFMADCTVPSCARPYNLTVTNVGATSATIGWTALGTESAWNVEYKPTNSSTWITEPTTSNPHILYGLNSSTAYDVRVQADCGSEVSDWRTGSFQTAGCEVADQCTFTFNMTDGYGDGWNGAAIEVKQENVTIATLTVPSSSSSAIEQVTLCDNANITLVWTSGTFDDECSFTVTTPFGEVIYTSGNLAAGTLVTFVAHCTPPTCPRPSSISVSDAGTNSATVSWVSAGTETAWNVEYKPVNSSTWTTEPTTSNPHILTGLTASTNYDVRVQADCGGGDLSDWREGTFQTQCDLTSLPYTETFDSYAGTSYDSPGPTPTCWTTYSVNTSYAPPHVISGGSYFYSASGNSLVFTSSSNGPNAYAALPTFDQPLNTLKLNFWRAMESTSYGELFVGYVTDLNNISGTFVSVTAIPSVDSPGDTISVDFSGVNIPAVGNICFHWYKESTYYSCFIDNVNVTLAGGAPVVTNPTVSTNAANPVAQTTATLHATITNPDNVTITAKGFEWKTTAGGTYAPIEGSGAGNGFTANLSNLTPNTSYTFKAFITFNGQTVYGSEQTFTTLQQGVEPCDVPTGLHTTSVTAESATVAWDNNPDVSSWNIQYRPQGGTLTSATSTTNSYVISGLTANTTYDVQVQAVCDGNNNSDWSALYSFTTTTGVESWLENSVTLFPNPAKEVVNVQCTMNNVQSVEVYDVFGKVVRIVGLPQCDSPTTRINVAGLANGVYFVRVTTDKGVVTKSFVKR